MAHENNFFSAPAVIPAKNLMSNESDKGIAEIQSAMIIAKKFPRDQRAALDRILTACERPSLAEVSQYQYAKGGTDITGPSIRMAEALAMSWGNISYGIKEISQEDGVSTVQSYAWDIETNTRREIVFQVPHIRHTKKGDYTLTDPREIYELVANQGARRLRACILGLIPGDVQDAAINQCNVTLNAACDMSVDAITKTIAGFSTLGVSKAAIEKRIQRRMDTITAAQMIGLKNIFNSIRDGMSSPNDWFEGSENGASENPEALEKALIAIDKASSKAEVDIVLSLIDGLAASDQKIARAKWMEKVAELKKSKASLLPGVKAKAKAEAKPEAKEEAKERNWLQEIKECGDKNMLNALLDEVPEDVQMENQELIDECLDALRD